MMIFLDGGIVVRFYSPLKPVLPDDTRLVLLQSCYNRRAFEPRGMYPKLLPGSRMMRFLRPEREEELALMQEATRALREIAPTAAYRYPVKLGGSMVPAVVVSGRDLVYLTLAAEAT